MSDTEKQDEVYDFIRTGGSVSFAELANYFGDWFKGDREWGMFEKNIVFWHELSREAIDVLTALLDSGRITMKPTTVLVYMFDGLYLRLPIAKRDMTYKSLRWLPVVFNKGSGKPEGSDEHRDIQVQGT